MYSDIYVALVGDRIQHKYNSKPHINSRQQKFAPLWRQWTTKRTRTKRSSGPFPLSANQHDRSHTSDSGEEEAHSAIKGCLRCALLRLRKGNICAWSGRERRTDGRARCALLPPPRLFLRSSRFKAILSVVCGDRDRARGWGRAAEWLQGTKFLRVGRARGMTDGRPTPLPSFPPPFLPALGEALEEEAMDGGGDSTWPAIM